MPLSFEIVQAFFLTCSHSLNLFIGTPINIFIVYRLASKDVKRSNYFRLLIFMCCLDIYVAPCEMWLYWADNMFDGFPKKNQLVLQEVSFISTQISDTAQNIQAALSLIVIIHWKTVMNSMPTIDKILYIVAGVYSLFDWILSNIIVLGVHYWNLRKTELFSVLFSYHRIITIGYMVIFIGVTVFCLICIRKVDTAAYSPQTLKAYKRMVFVHSTQSSLIITQLVYSYLGDIILVYFITPDHLWYDKAAKIYEGADMVFYHLKPFIRATFLVWALQRLLRTTKEEKIQQLTAHNTKDVV